MIINNKCKAVLFALDNVTVLDFDQAENFNTVYSYDTTQQLFLLREDGKFECNDLFINWDTGSGIINTEIKDMIEYSFDFGDLNGNWKGEPFYKLANDLFAKYRSKFRFKLASNNIIKFKKSSSNNTPPQGNEIHLIDDVFENSPLIAIHELVHFLRHESGFTSNRSHYTLDDDYGIYTNVQLMLESENGLFLDYWNNLHIHGVNPLDFTIINNLNYHVLKIKFLPELHEVEFDTEDFKDYLNSLDIFDTKLTNEYSKLDQRLKSINPFRVLSDVTKLLANPLSKEKLKARKLNLRSEYKYLSKFNENQKQRGYIQTNLNRIKDERVKLANGYLEYINHNYPKLLPQTKELRTKYCLTEVNLIKSEK